MTTKDLLYGVAMLLFMCVFLSCQKDKSEEFSQNNISPELKASSFSAILWANEDINIGTVTINESFHVVTVEYVTHNGWRLLQTNLHGEQEWEDIPQTAAGVPIIEQFEKIQLHSPSVSTFATTLDQDFYGCFYISAHAYVQYDPTDAFGDALPEKADLRIAYPYPGGPAYLPKMSISGSGSQLDGIHKGWSVDIGEPLQQNTSYQVDVYSSAEVLPQGVVDHPENFCYVNWIINNSFVGLDSPEGNGTYTFGDVQRAIWNFIDDKQSSIGLNPWDYDRAQEIIHAAHRNGEDFIPSCGDMIAVVLVPTNSAATTIMEISFDDFVPDCIIPNPNTSDQAWGEGRLFPGDGWGMYIPFCIEYVHR